jgi:hypothetical protein
MNLMSDVKNAQEAPHVEPSWDRKQPAWYEMSAGGTGGEPRGISGADWLLYGAIGAVALGIGVVNALSQAQDAVWHGGAYDVRTPLFWEISSIITIILLAPFLFVTVRRMRHASGWPLRIALAAAAILVFSALHIAGMVGLRKIVMFLAGGSYDFHLSVATPCLRVPQGHRHLRVDRRLAVADRRPRGGAVIPIVAGDTPGRYSLARPPHGLAPRRFGSNPHRASRHSMDQLCRKLR